MKLLGFDITKAQNKQQDTGKKRKRIKKITDSLQTQQLHRFGIQMDEYRDAVDLAESDTNPTWQELQRVYNDVLIDDQVTAAMQARLMGVTSTKWYLYNEDDTVNEEATKVLNHGWFDKYQMLVLGAKFFGYSAIQFGDIKDGTLSDVYSIPREYIHKTGRKMFTSLWANEDDSVSFDDPRFKNSVVFVSVDDHGILMQITPLAIWKKNALAFWSQYGEMYGNPIRVGMTDVLDDDLMDNMEDMVKEMGSRAWAVLNKEDDLKFIEANNTDVYNVFEKLALYVDNSTKKLILGSTMTMDDGSSRSQSEVHERNTNNFITSDLKEIERNVNSDLIPRLQHFGLLPENVRFGWDAEEKLSFEQKKEMLAVLLPHFAIDPEKVQELTGIEVEEYVPSAPTGQTESLENSLMKMQALYEGFKG